MALIPDIAAHGISFMHFFFHMEGGFEPIEDFWRTRGVPTVEWTGLSYFEVPGLSHSLTVSIQWRRVAKDCCDVRFALDTMSAKSLGLPEDKQYQIDESVFREFFDFARQQGVGGILARYGATLSGDLHFLDLPGNARLKRFVIEAGDKPAIITADFARDADGRWTVTLEPERLLRFLDKPVDDEFFEAPLKAATILITPLITGAGDEKRTTP